MAQISGPTGRGGGGAPLYFIKCVIAQKPLESPPLNIYILVLYDKTHSAIQTLGHMTKMAAMPIYGRNPSNILFSGTAGPISTKLSM